MIPDSPPVLPAETFAAHHFRDEAILGTRMNLIIRALSHSAALAAAHAARAEIDRLDLVFNSRRPDSELVALNSAASLTASPDLFAVIALAERMRTRTANAFSGRLGRLIDLWRSAGTSPDPAVTARLAADIAAGDVRLDPATRTIRRPEPVAFALDAVAKGYIVDRALTTARACPGVSSALVDIGGDIACAGAFPVGLSDLSFDNAPISLTLDLDNAAIATSGEGPRDRIVANTRFSPTLSPRTGQPVTATRSATAIAPTAAEADALATALMVMDPAEALAFAQDFPARILPRDGAPIASPHWRAELVPIQQRTTGAWHPGWQALATFTAPRRQLIRDPDFRSPYMAMWITTPDNKPVRTLILIGKHAEWQKDNYIWWQLNRGRQDKLVSTRSMSTSGAGVYNVFWDGRDDSGREIKPGPLVLHVETSRERGKHTYRRLDLDFTQARRFNEVLPPTEEGGGLTVGFDHY